MLCASPPSCCSSRLRTRAEVTLGTQTWLIVGEGLGVVVWHWPQLLVCGRSKADFSVAHVRPRECRQVRVTLIASWSTSSWLPVGSQVEASMSGCLRIAHDVSWEWCKIEEGGRKVQCWTGEVRWPSFVGFHRMEWKICRCEDGRGGGWQQLLKSFLSPSKSRKNLKTVFLVAT